MKKANKKKVPYMLSTDGDSRKGTAKPIIAEPTQLVPVIMLIPFYVEISDP